MIPINIIYRQNAAEEKIEIISVGLSEGSTYITFILCFQKNS